ncbi:MAG: NAD-dependent deacylase [Chloroflexota bacterium]|nr:NAD-dependent deacylase [Chloroflexota bacterium]
MALDDDIRQAAGWLAGCKRLAILTGAGVSKESGIPTFRDALDGLWARYDPTQLATPEAFAADPKLVWDFYAYRRQIARDVQPNAGHRALAALEQRIPTVTLITQNIDDLHELAGSKNVIRLHGRLTANKCLNHCQGEPTPIDIATLPNKDASPPTCPHCGAPVRPDVVWFGEALSPANLQAAFDAADHADVMLIVGTSGVVNPAAQLPGVAKHAGAKVIEVNPERTPLTRLADVWLAGASGDILPRVMAGMMNALDANE